MAKKRTYPLGYAVIGERVVHNNGNLRPATMQEISLWKELLKYEPSIAESSEELEERKMEQAVSDALEATDGD